ncbi:zinc finger protein 160 [Drosophila takahashii]|uniref:zinc finger protein 160 n=1 Tax=Drosophila takahashii TaxID=29030 RepID=UPI001CF81FA7|nr:zinc finger protein 808 [Drosophila takahashii]
MNTDDLEDTHLCIKCNATILGLTKYIEHRKRNCLLTEKQIATPTTEGPTTTSTPTQVSPTIISSSNLDHTYDGFHFAEPEAPSSYLRKTAASHGGKASKSLTEAYDLPYELGADLFFSSLQLQSVSTGGKTGSVARQERSKDEVWPAPSGDPLLKAVREHDETVFKPLNFDHDSPEGSEEEEDEEEHDDFEADDDEEECHSPPTVPATHTGGKWKPEHRPQLRHPHIERLSPSWDEPGEENYTHPPEDHTKGKWVPGSKQLEYRENIDLTKLEQPGASYWCNICCRRLKSRLNYEQHLRSGYHVKRADAECHLEQARLGSELNLSKDFVDSVEQTGEQKKKESKSPKRQRRANLLRCDLCRHTMARHLMGKHLISHYHYRRLQQQSRVRRQSCLQEILSHMGSIVRQSPFQCLPCRFYANTEEAFLQHWQSQEHSELTESLGGSFWCGYCQFECENNASMWLHLLHPSHKEVLLALNRSVPICIAQRRRLECPSCGVGFLYNFQLRRHFIAEHPGLAPAGTAADEYQCRFRCGLCGAPQKSRLALQRHEKHKHHVAKYYCAICRLEFETPLEARRHRSLMQHKLKARPKASVSQPEKEIEHMLREVLEEPTPNPPAKRSRVVNLKCSNCRETFDSPQSLAEHRTQVHSADNHLCLSCGTSFQSAQALGRHTRSCQPLASTSSSAAESLAKGKPSYCCDQCSFQSQYESDLVYHRIFHTRSGTIGKNELLKCPLCPKNFKKHSLRAHLRNHTDEKIFQCTECLLKFARRHNLKNHMATMHAKKEDREKAKLSKKTADDQPKPKYQCGTCGKILAKKHSLKLHELSHSKEVERRHRCHFADCSYAGVTPENLKSHLISHAQGKHKCERDNCSYVGKSKLHLKRHLKSAHSAKEEGGAEWFSCDQCEFRARIKSLLRRHSLVHSGQKPHQCPHCDFQCSTTDNLRKHIIKTGKHPGKFMYECTKCSDQAASEIFRSNSFKDFQKHLETHKAA